MVGRFFTSSHTGSTARHRIGRTVTEPTIATGTKIPSQQLRTATTIAPSTPHPIAGGTGTPGTSACPIIPAVTPTAADAMTRPPRNPLEAATAKAARLHPPSTSSRGTDVSGADATTSRIVPMSRNIDSRPPSAPSRPSTTPPSPVIRTGFRSRWNDACRVR